jgi:hypothetical protein
VSDGDRGLHAGEGFYHQELLAAGGGIRTSTPDRMMLPAGTACGFHHTQNSAADPSTGVGTCMGQDPGRGLCPKGWVARRHFDMSSGNGSRDCGKDDALNHPEACGFFVWCEYTDPNKLCTDPNCVARAARMATVRIQSNTDTTGATVRPFCPPGMTGTSFYDDGRPEGKGLSFCIGTPAGPGPQQQPSWNCPLKWVSPWEGQQWVQSDPVYASGTSTLLKVRNINTAQGKRCSLVFPNGYRLDVDAEATPAQLGLSNKLLELVIKAQPRPLDGQTSPWDVWVKLTYTP